MTQDTLGRIADDAGFRFIRTEQSRYANAKSRDAKKANSFEQLEILRVAGADLQHDTGRLTGLLQALVNLLDMAFMGHLHRHYPDTVAASQFEHIG